MNMFKNEIIVTGTAFAALFSANPALAQFSDKLTLPSGRGGAFHATSSYYSEPLSDTFYVGMDAGVAIQDDITVNNSLGESEEVAFDPGVRFDGQLGYCITKNWAAELDVGVIVSQVNRSIVLGAESMNVDLIQVPMVVNVIYSFPIGRGFSAYVGGGGGGIFSEYNNEFGGSTPSDEAFAYQALAGIRYAMSAQWEIGLGYKFLGTSRHDIGEGVGFDGYTPTTYKSDGTMTHAAMATLTYRF